MTLVTTVLHTHFLLKTKVLGLVVFAVQNLRRMVVPGPETLVSKDQVPTRAGRLNRALCARIVKNVQGVPASSTNLTFTLVDLQLTRLASLSRHQEVKN